MYGLEWGGGIGITTYVSILGGYAANRICRIVFNTYCRIGYESLSFVFYWSEYSVYMKLSSLTRGRKYVIDKIDCNDPVVQRLMVLGLVEGTEVELASAAIGGDPLEIRMFGNAISLRREQARHFRVSPVDPGG